MMERSKTSSDVNGTFYISCYVMSARLMTSLGKYEEIFM